MSWIMPPLPVPAAPYEASNQAGVQFAGDDGAIVSSYGIESVVKNGTGDYTVTLSSQLPNANYNVIVTCTNANYLIGTADKMVGSFDVEAKTVGALGVLVAADPPTVCVMVYQ